jgi:hypothetical protein
MDSVKISGILDKNLTMIMRLQTSGCEKRHFNLELEQRHVIKFFHLEGIKLDEITVELSSPYGEDEYTRTRRNIEFFESSKAKTVSECNMLVRDHFSTTLTRKHWEFSGNFHLPNPNHC